MPDRNRVTGADCGCGPTVAALALVDRAFTPRPESHGICHHCFKAIVTTSYPDYSGGLRDPETGILEPYIRYVALTPSCKHPTRNADWRITSTCPHCGGGEPLLIDEQAHLDDDDLPPSGCYEDPSYQDAERLILATQIGEMNACVPGSGDAYLSLDPRKRWTTGMREGNGRVLHRRFSESRWPRPCVGVP